MKIRQLGLQDYLPIYRAMCAFTDARTSDTEDELWVLQHRPVYTLGKRQTENHLLRPTIIPVISTDRGGQITYHGPGQVVIYTLIDFVRRGISVNALVRRLEEAVLHTLSLYGIVGGTIAGRPGVYIQGQKIASVGLRIRQGGVYHGLSLNVDMDLSPFFSIHPCGYPDQAVTQLKAWESSVSITKVMKDLTDWLIKEL